MASPGYCHPKGDTPSHAADRKKPAAAAASGRDDGKEAPAAKRAGMTRLPKEEVAQILSRDPRSMEPYKVEAMRRMLQQVRPNAPAPVEPLRVLAMSLNENMRKKFIVFQDWVRGEFDGKGYVEVTEEFIRDREEAQKGKEGQIPVDIDPYLPADEYFTFVSSKEDDGEEKLVFSLSKEKDASDSMEWSEEDDEEESEEENESDEEDDD